MSGVFSLGIVNFTILALIALAVITNSPIRNFTGPVL